MKIVLILHSNILHYNLVEANITNESRLIKVTFLGMYQCKHDFIASIVKRNDLELYEQKCNIWIFLLMWLAKKYISTPCFNNSEHIKYKRIVIGNILYILLSVCVCITHAYYT